MNSVVLIHDSILSNTFQWKKNLGITFIKNAKFCYFPLLLSFNFKSLVEEFRVSESNPKILCLEACGRFETSARVSHSHIESSIHIEYHHLVLCEKFASLLTALAIKKHKFECN